MKKLLTMFVMLLFILSMIPAAFAEEVTAISTDAKPTLYDGEAVKDRIRTGLNESKELIQERIDTCVSNTVERKDVTQEEAKTICVQAGLRKIEESVRTRLRQLSERFDSLTEEQKERVKSLTRAQIKKLEGLDKDTIKGRVQNMRSVKVKPKDLYRKREVAKEKIQAAEQRYKDAKNKYQEARKEFAGLKKEFHDAVKDKPEEEQVSAAKEYLAKSADMIIAHLEQVKEKVTANDDMEQDESSTIITQIDEKIETLEGLKQELEAAETKEETKAIAAKINAQWGSIKKGSEKVVGRVIAAKVGEIIKRSEQLEARAEKAIAVLVEKGIEVEDFDAKVDAFSAKIEEAREKYDNAKALYAQAKEDEKTSLVVKEAHAELRDAHDALKEAHRIYMDLFKALKQAGAGKELETEEVEVVDVIDETEEAEEEEAEVEDVFEDVEEDEEETEAEDNSTMAE